MPGKYYSLDECPDREMVSDYLESLEEEGKIYFESVDEDVIKIIDVSLTPREMKELLKYLDDNDILEVFDYEDDSDDYEDDSDSDLFDDF
jgi:hypothetical protein